MATEAHELVNLAYIIRALNIINGVRIKVEVSDEKSDEDQCYNDIIIDGWIYIHPYAHEYQIPLTNLFNIEVKYAITHEVVIPGVRYYPDMSGEPDTVGYQNVADNLTLREAISKVCELIIYNELKNSYDEDLPSDPFSDETPKRDTPKNTKRDSLQGDILFHWRQYNLAREELRKDFGITFSETDETFNNNC